MNVRRRRINIGGVVAVLGAVIAGLNSRGIADEIAPGVVVMRQMVIEAARIDPHPWYYVKFRDYEILSRCNAATTQSVAQHIRNSMAGFGILVPKQFYRSPPTPMTLIMFDHKPAAIMAEFMPEPVQPAKESPDFGPLSTSQVATSGIDVCDDDTHCVAQNRWGSDWSWAGGMTERGPIPTSLLFEMTQCEPPLPPWFIYAMTGPSGLLRMADFHDDSGKLVASVMAAPNWISDKRVHALVRFLARHRTGAAFPPLQQLFLPPVTRDRSPSIRWPDAEWMAEAALFVRWAMYSKPSDVESVWGQIGPGPRSGFLKFLQRCRYEQPTESLCRECFGFGYSEMRRRLAGYLTVQVDQPLIFPPNPATNDKTLVDTRKATTDEIGRILGDWLRMEALDLKQSDPLLAGDYRYAARVVLERAYREDNGLPPDEDPAHRLAPSAPRGAKVPTDHSIVELPPFVVSAARVHDPKLQAVIGLLKFDEGDDAQAEPLLLSAARARVRRPAVYLALVVIARRRLESGGQMSAYSPAQLRALLKPLGPLISDGQLGPRGYRLVAEVWGRSATPPDNLSKSVLLSGVANYPLDAELAALTRAALQDRHRE